MSNDLPTLVISRRPRHAGSDWNTARSWFGGRPRLGIHWRFGYIDVHQFWISPQDLRDGNWAAVSVTFECH
jgi:hypothetical protein